MEKERHDHHHSLATNVHPRSCGKGHHLGRVRVIFDSYSYIELWFDKHTLWRLSANDIKREAHRITSALVGDAESHPEVTRPAGAGASFNEGEQAGSLASDSRPSTGTSDGLVESRSNTAVEGNEAQAGVATAAGAATGPKNGTRRDKSLHGQLRVVTGRFPVAASSDEVGAELNRRHVTDSSPHELLAGVNEATAGSETFTGNVPGNVLGTTATAVAYDARLRLCSDVLHFHGKGLRSGAFLFLAVPDATGGDTSRDGRIGSGLSGSTSTSNSDSGSGSGRCAKVLAVAADTTTGSCGTGVRVGLRIKDAFERAGTGVEVRERAEKAGGRSGDGDGSSRQHAQAAGVGEEEDQRRTSRLPSPTPRAGSAERGFAGRDGAEGGGGELWVTDESAPLLSALSSQWAASAAPPAADDAGSSAAAKTRRSAHRAALKPPGATGGTPTTTAEGPRNDHPPIDHSFPVAVTLRVMPSGRAPLPPLCCGVCGSSWETDSFGRGYRAYHLAVANNASLVWYLKKRFSEFLALHAALSGRGGRGGEGDRIPEDRLPKPPTRTFGVLRLFPEKMERLRRDQLERYLQELLSIPEALTNRAVLSFLGLVSSSRHDLMSPPNPKRRGGQRTGKSPTLRAVARYSTASETPTTSSNRTTRGSTGRRMVDCRRGRAAAAESGAAAAVAAADVGECDGGATMGPREAAEGEATHFLPPAHETACQSPPPPNDNSDDGLGNARQAKENQRFREHPAVRRGRRGEPRAAADKEEEVVRKVERVTALEHAAHGGDVVLFRCRGMLSRLQRWVLRTQWDHVGVVVSGGPSGRLELLESTHGGVHLYPLVERVRAYHDQGFASRVAFRRLRCPRPAESRARLEEFSRQVQGKTYGIVLPFTPSGPKGDLSRTKHTPPPPSSPAVQPAVPSESADRGGEHGDGAQGGRVGLEDTRGKGPAFTVPKEEQVVVFANAADRGEGQSGSATANAIGESTTLPSFSSGKSETTPLNPSYLCSQLVGAALSEMGVLRGGGGDLGWLWVVPGAFGQGGAVDSRLADGVALGEEILVDAHEPEVAGAVLLGDAIN